MYEARNLYVNTFAAYNGGTQARYWSVGYYTAQGAEACDDTWVQIDSLPDDTEWAKIEEYLTDLNTPVTEQAPTQAEDTPEGTSANPPHVFEEVTEDSAPSFGLFVFKTIGGDWYSTADLPNMRCYMNGPWRTQEQAEQDVRRIAPMYPRLHWYRVR